jgi:hypothetical protein
MRSISVSSLPLLSPSGDNMALINPKLYLRIEQLRSKARATSIFFGVTHSTWFYPNPALPSVPQIQKAPHGGLLDDLAHG